MSFAFSLQYAFLHWMTLLSNTSANSFEVSLAVISNDGISAVALRCCYKSSMVSAKRVQLQCNLCSNLLWLWTESRVRSFSLQKWLGQLGSKQVQILKCMESNKNLLFRDLARARDVLELDLNLQYYNQNFIVKLVRFLQHPYFAWRACQSLWPSFRCMCAIYQAVCSSYK